MTNAAQTKPTPIPAILVYGTPTSPELTQASWFGAEDKQEAQAAAVGLKFSVIEIQTDAEKALTVGVHEGVLKGSGRMIVSSVSTEVYRRIEEYARKASGAEAPPKLEATAAIKPSSEQNMNLAPADKATTASKPKNTDPTSTAIKPVPAGSSAASPPSKPEKLAAALDSWDALRVGSRVVAKYWENDGSPYGWWIAEITGIEKSDFIIRWLDEPKTPPFKIERKHVAILHPAFDVNYEWVKRR